MRPLLCLLALSSALFAETIADRKVVLGLVDTCAQAPKTYEAEGFKPVREWNRVTITGGAKRSFRAAFTGPSLLFLKNSAR